VLPPDQQAVVFLKEVFGFTSLEGSKLLGISESVFRHHLSEGRRVMEQAFEQLCSLIGKRGACYQCKELRESMPPGKQGEDLAGIGRPEDDLEHKLEARLQIVREADLTQGPSAKLHALFFQFLANVEEGRPLSLKN
jgi:RNA polymerase sigma-70 factor (ECF subfamily)